ncbi:hypothetical protein [Sutcliffiella sp. NC1]|uniref:hypothetical protein n=1 Tax=Sutcliffiella sp. NC1 TaxID=3004096 RepID=UPI0022DDA47E|nr:hypothetical protein [Sutcliffiella sp. NC1]WBL16869.1 hypothetical protein O1A01_09630 [Sutcliffiella sp. NC1]
MIEYKILLSIQTNEFYSFFDNMTIASITFLAWTSAVIAALLAVTTIIFSQFNERLIHRVNDISKEIQALMSKRENHQLIIEKINEIIYLNANKKVYKSTLYYFFFLSYLSGGLWVLSGIGYILDQVNISSGDLTVIVLAIFAIFLTFFGLPIILFQFNRNPALKVDNKNRTSLSNLISYFNSITRISNELIIKDYIQPTLNFTISLSGKLMISSNQQVPISNVTYIFECVGKSNSKQIIKLKSNSAKKYNEYKVKPLNKNENNFEGLYNIIKSSTYQNLYVFSPKGEAIATYKLWISSDSENKISLNIHEYFNMSPDSYIIKALTTKKWLHVFQAENKQNEYKLIKVK